MTKRSPRKLQASARWRTVVKLARRTDFGNNPIKAKIQDAEQLRVHTMLVIGGRDMDASAVSVRLHGKGPKGAKPKAEVVAEIKERRA